MDRFLQTRGADWHDVPAVRELRELVDATSGAIPWSAVGLTGSLLVGFEKESSDIDLICLGLDSRTAIAEAIDARGAVIRYDSSQELALNLYNRRMTYLAPMPFERLMYQESRKLQGVTVRHRVHFNCQPLRSAHEYDPFRNLALYEVGTITCTARIRDDSQGWYAPALYEIAVDDVIEAMINPSLCRTKCKYLISYLGVYAGAFRSGDRVYLQGKLVVCEGDFGDAFAVEVSPWNTVIPYRAELLALAEACA